uniref:Uncharacterized protein n=1 Tax=Vespula pensylvanica TaxID=30213 RepID=A0A834JV24_VESPE|nr:hypothetical protein H0235_016747 [Vespula pensylvanica]
MPIAGRVPYRQNALSSGASSSKADCSLACGNSIYGTLKWYPVSGTAPPPPPSPHLHPPLASEEKGSPRDAIIVLSRAERRARGKVANRSNSFCLRNCLTGRSVMSQAAYVTVSLDERMH